MAELNGRIGGVYRFLDWPLRLVGLNLLWILGVLAGLVVGGLAPSTLALYSLIREYLLGRSPRPWHDFWTQWRAALTSSQLVLGLPIVTVWVVVFYALAARDTPFALGVGLLAIAYLATLFQLPAVMAHLDLPATGVWKATVVIAWRRPLGTLGTAALAVGLLGGAWFLTPAAVPLFFPSLPATLGTLVVRRGLPSLER